MLHQLNLRKLTNDSLTNSKLANDKLTNDKLVNDKLANSKLASSKLTNDRWANNKLADDNMANDKIAKDRFANGKLANDKIANEKFATTKMKQRMSMSAKMLKNEKAALHRESIMIEDLMRKYHLPELGDFMIKMGTAAGKRNFLVFKNNKYINILTENIAFFYVRHESTIIVNLESQEYFINNSLEQIQNLLSSTQFFRINRQYLVNFNAIKEAEHYFARKLLVHLAVPVKDKLVVSKEKVSDFLDWLDNR